jgi:hypothetical protein
VRALLPAVLFAAALVASAEDGSDAPKPGPRALFLRRCSSCHDPNRVYHRVADRDEWREIVERMRRMPQSGISPEDARTILDYLVSLRRAPAKESDGGREAYGDEWLSVLETARVREGRARLGGREYEVAVDGRSATLRHGKETHVVALPGEDGAPLTARVAQWQVGDARYEVHLILYRVRGGSAVLGRALRRVP